jgi:hypothetical protein
MLKNKHTLTLTDKQAFVVYDCVELVLSRGGITGIDDLEAVIVVKKQLLSIKCVSSAVEKNKKSKVV